MSTTTARDDDWVAANGGLLAAAARGLYGRLCPGGQLVGDAIRQIVAAWSFRVLEPIAVDLGLDENFYIVEDGPHQSFLDLRETMEAELDEGSQEDDLPRNEEPTNASVQTEEQQRGGFWPTAPMPVFLPRPSAQMPMFLPRPTAPMPMFLPMVRPIPFVMLPVPTFRRPEETFIRVFPYQPNGQGER